MSSHHIVREDQEPALFIMDAHVVPLEQVQDLLEWCPTVIVSEIALPEVLNWGIKIDVVIAHADNIPSLTNTLLDQSPVTLLSYNKPEEALSTALYFLISTKQKAVNIVTTESLERFEEFSTLYISVFHADRRWSFIRSGLYEKWVPAGRIIQVYPLDGESTMKAERDGVMVIRREKGFWVCDG